MTWRAGGLKKLLAVREDLRCRLQRILQPHRHQLELHRRYRRLIGHSHRLSVVNVVMNSIRRQSSGGHRARRNCERLQRRPSEHIYAPGKSVRRKRCSAGHRQRHRARYGGECYPRPYTQSSKAQAHILAHPGFPASTFFTLPSPPDRRHLILSAPQESNHRASVTGGIGHCVSPYFTMMVPFIASFSCGTQV